MTSPVAIANYFIAQASQHGVRDFPATKIHDLVFMAQGWHLGAHGKRLFEGAIMAARDGILIPDLRDAGCSGGRNCGEPLSVYATDDTRGMMTEQTPEIPADSPLVKTLTWVWQTYGHLAAYEISRFTREPGGPWDLLWNDEERPNEEPRQIPTGTTKLWFREQLRGMPGVGHLLGADPEAAQTQSVLERPDPNRLRKV
jgi:uncharacterized phage-associated protein